MFLSFAPQYMKKEFILDCVDAAGERTVLNVSMNAMPYATLGMWPGTRIEIVDTDSGGHVLVSAPTARDSSDMTAAYSTHLINWYKDSEFSMGGIGLDLSEIVDDFLTRTDDEHADLLTFIHQRLKTSTEKTKEAIAAIRSSYTRVNMYTHLKADLKSVTTVDDATIRYIANHVTYIDRFRRNPFDRNYNRVPVASFATYHALQAFATEVYGLPWEGRVSLASIECLLTMQSELSGHTCFSRDRLVTLYMMHTRGFGDVVSRVSVDRQLEVQSVFTLVDRGPGTKEFVYSTHTFNQELAIASTVRLLIDAPKSKPRHTKSFEESRVESYLSMYEDMYKVKLGDEQRLVVFEIFCRSDIVILNGPGGCGKSKTCEAIAFIANGFGLMKILQCAPTGIAANRLKDGTTIHRALHAEYSPDGVFTFAKGPQSPLDYDFIFVDEMSMVDVPLMATLMGATRPGHSKVILIGDVHQLQSVSYGDVFNNLVRSGKIATVSLTKVHRQSEDSKIFRLANLVRSRCIPAEADLRNGDVEWFELTSQADVNAKLAELFMKYRDRSFQIITPCRNTPVGVHQQNLHIHTLLVGSRDVHKFVVGERAMCTKNAFVYGEGDVPVYAECVSNGEIGHVLADHKRDSKTSGSAFSIRIPGTHGRPDKDMRIELQNLEYAHSCTVHKVQGSEFEVVVVCLHNSFSRMLTNELLYTAITRASKHLIIISDEASLMTAITTPAPERFSFLSVMI